MFLLRLKAAQAKAMGQCSTAELAASQIRSQAMSQEGLQLERSTTNIASDDNERSVMDKVVSFLSDLSARPEDPSCRAFASLDTQAMINFAKKRPEEDYAPEQQEIHEKFQQLFESTCGDLLRSCGYTPSDFYEEVEYATAACPQGLTEPDTVLSILREVLDFRYWSERIRQRVHKEKAEEDI